MVTKTKIVLDADVIIHFIKGGLFSLLLEIFPEYEYLILDVVYKEVTVSQASKTQIDNTLQFLGNRISQVKFDPKGESRLEYAKLITTLGRGESACMVFCRDNQDVLGSSNLRDIKEYCKRNFITYLTTIDFLYFAYVKKKLSAEECSKFIKEVNDKGSRLPVVDITAYVPSCKI